MNDRSNLTRLGFLGVILAVILSPAAREAPTTNSAVAPAAGDTIPFHGAKSGSGRDLIRQYFGGRQRPYDLEIIIATVPDPYDSRLDHQYDLFVESLRRAFEADDYVLDRYWLPGRNDSTKVSGRTNPRDSIVRATREVRPGVMLFRGNAKDSSGKIRLGLLYLVGEVPTSGVHKDALLAALNERNVLKSELRDPLTIRIVGPSFSGSSVSIRETLDAYMAGTEFRALVITGSATDMANARILRSDRIRFASTLHDDATLQRILKTQVLDSLKLKRVAYLHESTTTYGATFEQLEQFDSHTKSSGIPPRDNHGDADSGALTLSIPFPLNISTVRAEFARNPEKVEQNTLPGARATDRLPLQLSSGSNPKESPPVVSVLTAPTLELVLDQIIETLRAHEIQAVGLIATDVRDKLFLGELIRRRLPDVLLFTFESNALYLRHDYGRSLRGMIVLSTYPLWPENQRWSGAGPTDTQHRDENVSLFASDGAQGSYNAAVMQLQAPEKLVEYQLPVQASGDSGGSTPPVWITAIGSHSIQPLAACRIDLQKTGSSGYLARLDGSDVHSPAAVAGPDCPPLSEHGDLDRHDISFLGWAGGIALELLLASAILGYLRLALKKREPLTVWQEIRQLGKRDAASREAVEENSLWIHAHLYSALRLIAVAGMFMPVAAIIVMGGERFHMHHNRHALWIAAVVIVLGLLLTTIACELRPVEETEEARGGRRITLLQTSCGLASALAASLWLAARSGGFPWETIILWGTLITLAIFWVAALVYAAVSMAALLILNTGPYWTLIRNAGATSNTRFDGGRQGRAWIVEFVLRGIVASFGLCYFWLTLRFVSSLNNLREKDFRFIPFFHRSIQMDSGLSPVLPLVLAGGTFALWACWHVRRVNRLLDSTAYEQAMYLRSTCRVQSSAEAGSSQQRAINTTLENVSKQVSVVRDRLFFLIPTGAAALLFFLLAGLLAWLWQQKGPTAEYVTLGTEGGNAFSTLLFATVAATFCATIWSIYRLHSLWSGLRDMLSALAQTPLLSAFERLPRRMIGFSKPSLIHNPSRDAVGVTTDMQWRHLQRIYNDASPEFKELLSGFVSNEVERPEEVLDKLMTDTGVVWSRPNLKSDRVLRVQKMGCWLASLHRLLAVMWESEPVKEDIQREITALETPGKAGEALSQRNTSDVLCRRFTSSVGIWLKVAEELAAVQAVNYIEWVQQHLRTLSFFLLASVLTTTALLSAYPFQPASMLRLLFVFVVIAAIGCIFYVMTEMNRNEVLSKINNTAAGKIEWDAMFIGNVVVYVVLPLVTLLSAQFPELGSVVFAWADPLVHSLTKI